jgi:hypothetical protein
MSLEIFVADSHTTFTPGQEITGQVRWALDRAPSWLEVRLFWYTEGKGTQDVRVMAQERFTDLDAHGEKPFRLRAPVSPPSCSGRLVSIRWALELVSGDVQPVAKVDLVIGPGGRELVLGHVD